MLYETGIFSSFLRNGEILSWKVVKFFDPAVLLDLKLRFGLHNQSDVNKEKALLEFAEKWVKEFNDSYIYDI